MQVPAVPSPSRSSSAAGALPQNSVINGSAALLAPSRLQALRGQQQQATQDALATLAASDLPLGRKNGESSPYREPGLQERLGQLQQGSAYAEQLGQALQGLKSSLSQTLVRQQGQPDAALQGRLDQVKRLWDARGELSGGQLDGQLQTVDAGEAARQRFRIRGLDMATLASNGAETLRLGVPGQPRSIAVPLDGQGLQRGLQSLQRALAPTDLRVETQGGELAFSAPESQWPALRDGLSIKGDGKRFPSGQMVRVALEPQADVLKPATLQLEGTEAQRRSLAQVLSTQERLGQARQRLNQSLADASQLTTESAAAQGEARAVHAFANDFAVNADAAPLDYEQLSALVPALLGLHKRQVQQLLQPRAGG